MNWRGALKWSFLTELAAKAVQPLVFIILARLLSPEDFGVMAAALMVLGFSQVFWEAGMGKALIQRQKDVLAAADVAFWVNIALGLAIGILLFVSAQQIALYVFDDERVSAVIQVMSLQVFLAAAGSVHTAYLRKYMGFKKLFWIRFATIAIPGLASIPLAWSGMGYWALVAGTLVGQAVQLMMLWSMSGWRPRVSFDVQVARDMVHFGGWVAASGLLAWFYTWADSLIVGVYMGSHELGLYRTGTLFAGMFFALLFGPITPVLYSHLSRMNQNQDRMRSATTRILTLVVYISVPVSIVVFAVADQVAEVVFGPQWQGIAIVIGVMTLTQGLAWTVGFHGEIYRAMGKPSYETIVMATTLAVYLIAYLYSVRHGLETFVWTRMGLTMGGVVVHMIVIRKLLQLRLAPVLRHFVIAVFLSVSGVVVVNHFLKGGLNPAWLDLGVRFSVCLLVISGLIYLIERKGLVRDIYAIVVPSVGGSEKEGRQ
jgi:O-antigen/teichoic acid export membrane protein